MTAVADNKISLGRYQTTALAVGGVASVVCAAAGWLNTDRFFQSYLVAFLYWWTAAMGCMGLALLYRMTGGRWGYAARPFFDAGIRTLPLLVLAFVPIGLGLRTLYPWSAPDYFAGDSHAANRAWYLQESFFIGRSAGYLLLAAVIGLLVSARTVVGGKVNPNSHPTLAGLATVASVLLVSFAVSDWGMSLDPAWYSTMYGGIFIAGGLLTGLCLVTTGVALSVERLDRRDETTVTIVHDLGKLLFAFLMVWAYFSFSQFLIIYAGNLPVEAVWYVPRVQGGWMFVALAIVLLHFFVPFFLLLSRDWKRHPRRLAQVATAVAVVHVMEIYWTIIPSFHADQFSFHLLDIAAPLALGGFVVFEFLRQLKSRLLPVVDHWPHELAGVTTSGEEASQHEL